jgi:hypothetical protein
VIDVTKAKNGKVLQVLMNADHEQALGYFTEPGARAKIMIEPGLTCSVDTDEHSCWRLQMAERIAHHCDAQKWGVKAIYAFGPAVAGGAGPDGEIGLVVHFDGRPQHKKALETWLQGWSLSLAEFNHQRTGYQSEGLLDVRLVAGSEIKNRASVAALVNVQEEEVKKLPLGDARH